MELINFDGYAQNNRMYGGLSGAKIGISYQGADYILKYPQNLKEKNLNNVRMSYSTAPVSEYLGSHIYALLGIPVHDTLLGRRKGKIVAACRDFLEQGDRLFEFRQIKTTFEPQGEDFDSGSETSGNGVELSDILKIIDEHPLFHQIEGVKERFWQMFVVDAYIGNMDRNNGNWGVIMRYDGGVELAPVYDNGGGLNNKWDDERILPILYDTANMQIQAYRGIVSIFEQDGRRINPFHYIAATDSADCMRALTLIVPQIRAKEPEICAMIEGIPVLSDIQKAFLRRILALRLEEALLPCYERIIRQHREGV